MMPNSIDAKLAYLALKAAQKNFGKSPAALSPADLMHVQGIARRQQQLEARVLRSNEAHNAMVPAATLQAALEEIRGRYQSADELMDDLALNGLDEASFAAAIESELRVEAILEKVATRADQVSDLDIALYFHYHPEQCRRPETRMVSHILITINEQFPDNTRSEALLRITAIAGRLLKEPHRFAEQALKHSECPTALHNGALGELPRGKLYPELDQILFAMSAGSISDVIESPLGFHLLRCEAITEGCMFNLDQAGPHIRKLLERKRKSICQKAWLAQLG
jgi:peptidyl-prolyl cis-trans isomerase C